MRILFGANPRGTLIRAAVLIAAAVVVFGFILLPIRMEGISMLARRSKPRVQGVQTTVHPFVRLNVLGVQKFAALRYHTW